VVERARVEKEELLRALGEQINDSIKRTNSSYNTAIANRDYDDILYDPKGSKYLEKFAKIRIPADSQPPHRFLLKGSAQTQLLQYLSPQSATAMTSKSTCCVTTPSTKRWLSSRSSPASARGNWKPHSTSPLPENTSFSYSRAAE
jgi:hypothetical protein